MGDKAFREDLKKPDEFLIRLRNLGGYGKEHWRVILGLICLVLILVGGFSVWESKKAKQDQLAADDFVTLSKEMPGESLFAFPTSDEADKAEKSKTWESVLPKIDAFLQKHKTSSLHPMGLLYRGKALLALGRPADARTSFDQAAEKLPKDFVILALEGKGTAWMAEKKYEEASKLWKDLSERKDNPTRGDHLFQMGLAMSSQGKSEEAKRIFQQIQSEFPNSVLSEKAVLHEQAL